MEKQLKSAAAWFEIPCVDLNRAKRFYEIILGVRLDKNDFGDSNDVMCVFPAERGAVAGALVQRSFQHMVPYSIAEAGDDLEAAVQ